MQDKFKFSDDMEAKILACLIRHPEKFLDSYDVVRPACFNGAVAFDVAYEHERYRRTYNRSPDWTMLGNLLYTRIAPQNPNHAKECVDYVKKLLKLSTDDVDAVRDLVAAFAKEREMPGDAGYEGEKTPAGLRMNEDARTACKCGMFNCDGDNPLFDRDISIQARFLWMVQRHIEMRPSRPLPTTHELCEIMAVRDETLRKYRQELVEHGWLCAESKRNSMMRFAETVYRTLPRD